MVLGIMVPHFPATGSGGVPPLPPTILMSGFGFPSFLRIIHVHLYPSISLYINLPLSQLLTLSTQSRPPAQLTSTTLLYSLLPPQTDRDY